MHPFKKYTYSKRRFRIFTPSWIGGSEYCVQSGLVPYTPKWIGGSEFCVQE